MYWLLNRPLQVKDLPTAPEGRTGFPWTEGTTTLLKALPGGQDYPKISIVTPSYNQGQYLEETIRSVLLQGYPNLEYIIIDGGSTDSSVAIIQKYAHFLSYWVTERDSGQTNAINKGFARSSGEIMGWLNSDDVLLPEALHRIARTMVRKPDVQIVTGFRKVLDVQSRVTNNFVQDIPTNYYLRHYCCIAQETTYWRSSVWEQLGPLDETLQFAMDYEYWLRAIERGYSFYLIPSYTGGFRNYAENKTNSWIDVYRRDMRTLYRRYGMGREEADVHAQLGTRWARRYGFYVAMGNQAWTNSTRLVQLAWYVLESPLLCNLVLLTWYERKHYRRMREVGHKSHASAFASILADLMQHIVMSIRRNPRVPVNPHSDIRTIPQENFFDGNEHELPIPANTLALGEGWYPVEAYGGEYFRWCSGIGEILILNADASQKELYIVVSPVAKVPGGALLLVDERGEQIAIAPLDRHGLEIIFELPPVESARVKYELHWNGDIPLPKDSDPRKFAFRLFRIGWRTSETKREGAGLPTALPQLVRRQGSKLPIIGVVVVALRRAWNMHNVTVEQSFPMTNGENTGLLPLEPAAIPNYSPTSSLENVSSARPSLLDAGHRDHDLMGMMTIALCAALCGAETWEEVEEFGETKEAWLRQYLDLPQSTPAEDLFRRVFSLFEANVFQEKTLELVDAVFTVRDDQGTKHDDNSGPRATDAAQRQDWLRLVTVSSTDSGVILGQPKSGGERNKTVSILELLEYLSLANSVVSIDAPDCHTEIIEQIVTQKSDYIVAVKANLHRLYSTLVEQFARVKQGEFQDLPINYAETTDKSQGQIEIRRCWALSDTGGFEALGQDWLKLTSIALVEREQRTGEQVQTDRAYFLSSLPADAGALLGYVRRYWALDDQFQWVLDVSFNEGVERFQVTDGGDNYAMLNQAALKLLRYSVGGSLKRKRFKAALDETFLLEILSNSRSRFK